jgi:predicted RNA-binding Zn-ribbon protein involved in translation (DUF1610 family)
MAALVEVPCSSCLELAQLREDDEAFDCPGCNGHFRFYLCPWCESVGQFVAFVRGHRFTCPWCRNETRVPYVGDKLTATAAERRAELDERGFVGASPDNVVVGGFTLVGGAGFDLEPGATCSVLSLPDAVDVRAEGRGGRGGPASVS